MTPAPRLRGARRQPPEGPLTPERIEAALVTLARLNKQHPGLLPPESLRTAAAGLLAEKNRLSNEIDIESLLSRLAG